MTETEVARGALDRMVQAVMNLGGNRLPLVDTKKIHRNKKRLIELVSEREDLRKELIRQYDEDGQGWQDPDDAPVELVEKITDLMTETVTVEVEPIRLNGAGDIELSTDDYENLLALGILEDDNDPDDDG